MNDRDALDVLAGDDEFRREATIIFGVTYDERITTGDDVVQALGILLDTALSTAGVLDEVGNPQVGELSLFSDIEA